MNKKQLQSYIFITGGYVFLAIIVAGWSAYCAWIKDFNFMIYTLLLSISLIMGTTYKSDPKEEK